MPSFAKSALAAMVAALAVSAAAAEGSRKTLELTADATTAEMELGFDTEGARRRALQGEYASGNVDPLGPDVSGPGDGSQGSAAIIEIVQRRGGGGGSF